MALCVLEEGMGKTTPNYQILEKQIYDMLDHMTYTPYMVPYWVEAIMKIVKDWIEENKKHLIT